MKKRIWFWGLVLLALLLPLAGATPSPGAEPGVKYIDKDTLKGILGAPNLIIIDVRHESAWASSNRKIKGAIRFSPDRVAAWGPLLPKDKEFVLY